MNTLSHKIIDFVCLLPSFMKGSLTLNGKSVNSARRLCDGASYHCPLDHFKLYIEQKEMSQELYNQAVNSSSNGWLIAVWQQNYENKLLIPGLLFVEHEILSAARHWNSFDVMYDEQSAVKLLSRLFEEVTGTSLSYQTDNKKIIRSARHLHASTDASFFSQLFNKENNI